MSAEDTFATRMRQVRESHGWSQIALGDRMRVEGVDLRRSAISEIESGKRHIRLDEAIAVAAALKVQVNDLLRPVNCTTCKDIPPTGFTCQKCQRDG